MLDLGEASVAHKPQFTCFVGSLLWQYSDDQFESLPIGSIVVPFCGLYIYIYIYIYRVL